MSLATDIDNESIDMSLWRRRQNSQLIRDDLARRERNRRDEDDDDERERQAVAEEHAHLMKVMAARQAALTHQAVADRRAEQESLQAWRAGLNDRRDY